MASSRTSEEFDEISRVYDDTREPLEPGVIESVSAALQDWGIHSLLEVGVGTGRVALPLAARGLELTGLDASAGMLSRARAKQLGRLIRGNAYALPFADGSFDAALFVHVLHILDEPFRAIREACRVGRRGAVGLVRPRPGPESPPDRRSDPRTIVIDRLREEGIDVPERARGGPPTRERRLLEQAPPDRLTVVSEADVTEPLAHALELFERRASRWTLRVPPAVLDRAVRHARSEVGDMTHTYHRVLALALWERPPHDPPPVAGGVS